MKLTQKDLDNLNKLLIDAVYHGGDPGGAYFCYPDEFYESVKNFMESSECEVEIYWAQFEFNTKGHFYLCESKTEDVEKGKCKYFLQVRFKNGKEISK